MNGWLIAAGFLLVLPLYVILWVWVITVVKKLWFKEEVKQKGLVEEYSKLTPEQRMDLDLHREPATTPTQQAPTPDNNTQWLGSPTPQAEVAAQSQQVFEEGIVHNTPDGRWESHEEANRAPSTTITNPQALAPKP